MVIVINYLLDRELTLASNITFVILVDSLVRISILRSRDNIDLRIITVTCDTSPKFRSRQKV